MDDKTENNLRQLNEKCSDHGKLRRNSIFTHTYNPDEDANFYENSYQGDRIDEEKKEMSPEIRSKLAEILRSIVMFKHLCDEDFNQILDNMFERRCGKDEVIIKEGDDGNYFYVIHKGRFEILQKGKNDVLKLGEYNNSGFFGELALLYNQPRSASVISLEEGGILWAMNRDTFKRLVISNAFKRRKMFEKFLKSVPFLKECLTDYERMQIADSLSTQIFKKDNCIFKDGDDAKGMFFIEEGEVRIIKSGTDEVILSKGDYFGEFALINKTRRSASAYCYSNVCKVAFLEIEVFERLMGPCINVFKQNISNYRLV